MFPRRTVDRALDIARTWTPPAAALLALLALWEVIVRWERVPEYLVPAPSRIAAVGLSGIGKLWKDTTITAAEALLGFAISNVVSLLVAVGFAHSRWFERSFYPYVIALKSVPIIAIAPLLVLWFGYGLIGKAVMAAIVSFFPLVVNATIGLKEVDQEALDLMRSISATRVQVLLKLRLPNALPYIFAALKVSVTLSVVGAIVAELTGATRGIGFVILMASYNTDTPLLFAAITCASGLGIALFCLVSVIESFVLSRLFGSAPLAQRSRHAK